MKTRCLLVDDEPLAIQLLQKHVEQIPSFTVVATAQNAVAALDILRSQPIDLLFCDIQMPGLTGIEFLKTLKQPPKTILTTAHREFALDGYDLDVIDYLLKPITFTRFFSAVERFMRHQLPTQPPVASEPAAFVIQVKSGSTYYKVPVHTILYVESQKDYVRLLTTEREIISKQTLSDIADQLAPADFLRIHRSYLVNQQRVVAYSATHVEVGSHQLPIGASYRAWVLRALGQPI
jgi:two-component system, LytTR family, response regulator